MGDTTEVIFDLSDQNHVYDHVYDSSDQKYPRNRTDQNSTRYRGGRGVTLTDYEEARKEPQKKEKWDDFKTDGATQMSVSERKYDKSLQTKYKLLKVRIYFSESLIANSS